MFVQSKSLKEEKKKKKINGDSAAHRFRTSAD